MTDEKEANLPPNARLLDPFLLGVPVEIVIDGLTAESLAADDQPVVSAEGEITVAWDTGPGKTLKL